MKKILFSLLCAALMALTLTSCGKQKVCRCSVLHSQTIRLVELDRGDCRDIRFVYYDEDELTPNVTDSVLCTDHEFSEDL